MIRFFTGTYSPTHWIHKPEPEFLVNAFEFHLLVKPDEKETKKYQFEVKLNPTDCRCYRLLVICKNPEVANRSFTSKECNALMTIVNRVIDDVKPYEIGMVPQIEMAANNAMSLTEDGVIQLGSDKEPFRLHAHIIFRGIQGKEHIPGVPYQGPQPGELFNMRDGKVKWDPEKLKAAMEFFKSKY